ncbi:MAG TPA: YgiT-type zinc finger protein [Candidatus Bilamarchaeaceae archaeon]|nr:YgiT-type zinc finger protein [Candidatus Bilamarchaeaceae archaeon]
MTPKCVNCKHAMKKVSNVNKMFLNRYIISDATVYVCQTCGEEYLEAKEYERIRKKIDAIEIKADIPAVHQVMARTKFLVL